MIGTPLAETDFNYRHIALKACDSTNNYALNLGREGEPSNFWVTASAQTDGKGSRGRDWISLEGNLFASLFLRDVAPLENLYQLTFIAAISVSDAIVEFAPNANITHKWPNDVLLNQKKCSGILLESTTYKNETQLVIGIGVNCGATPKGNLLNKSTSLAEEDIKVSVDDLFRAIAKHMASNISLWDSGIQFAAIRNAWLKKAHGLGEKISIKLPGKPMEEGVFSGLNENGQLLLEIANGTIKEISTADIFFNQAKAAGSDI